MKTGVLGGIRGRFLAWGVLHTLLVVIACAAAGTLALLLLDAALDLSDFARVITPWCIAAACLALVIAFTAKARSLDEHRIARLLERNDTSLGTKLTNAVEFDRVPRESGIGELLRHEALELGRANASRVRVWPFVRRGIAAACGLTVSFAAAWVVTGFVARDVVEAVLPRFLDPHGDHPPFSHLKINVAPTHGTVLFGGQFEVRSTTSGRPADKLWLIAKSATNETRAMMFLAPDRSFFQTLVNLREPTEFFVTDGRARSRRFPIAIRYTPQITRVEVTTAFPEYTGKPARTAALSDEVTALPEGTRVSFRISSNRPLRDGELTLTPVLGGAARRLTLQTNEPNIVAGEFTLEAPTAFAISVHDVEGLASAETKQGRFNVLPDERPRLFVLEPGRNAAATPAFRVPVRVQAQDDYGVARVVWLRGHNRSIERPFNMKVELKNGAQSVESAGAFELAKLGVKPGDVIDYYFEAADNYPKGPNVALSRMYRLEIISQEQYEQVLRQMAARKALFEPYFQLGAWLKRLAERARDLQDRADSSNAAEKQSLPKDAADLANEIQKLRERLGKVAEQAIMFDVEQAFKTSLVAQDAALGEAGKKLKQAAGSGSPNADELRDVARALTQLAQADAEEVTDPAQQIAAVSHLLARADTFVRLAKEEEAVARMLRRFAERTNALSRPEQIEVQELAHQQGRIEEELRKLLTSLPELLAQLPEDAQFKPLRDDIEKFVQDVGDAKIKEDLNASAKSLSDHDAMTGHALAQSAAEKMDKLIARCRADGQLGERAVQCLRFKPKIQQAFGNTMAQILAAMGAGNGGGGRDGYGLFNENVALYGPNTPVAGEQAGARGRSNEASARSAERVASDATDTALPKPGEPGRVRLQPNAKFPLRYRDIVGEYFKAIAETEEKK